MMSPAPKNTKPENASAADWIASLPKARRETELRKLAPTRAAERALEYSWAFWGRAKQFAPAGNWLVWLILAGRGFGKTRTGAEWIRHRVEREGARHLRFIGRTAADVRDVMVEGESGILAISPPWNRPKYEPSKRRLTWKNGAVATTFSAEEPNALRGPQSDTDWADEVAAWDYPDDTWNQMAFGRRLGVHYGVTPRALATTTPRPLPIIRDLLSDKSTATTRGSTYENQKNLAAPFLHFILRKYAGTRLGRQELEAEILDDTPGALWTRARIDLLRAPLRYNDFGIPEPVAALRARLLPLLRAIYVAVDPAVSTEEGSGETGIVVVGVGYDGHGYVLADLSKKYSPGEWAAVVVQAVDDWEADCVVAEVNQGGDLVKSNIHTVRRALRVMTVHASRGKRTRAEPVGALYEQGRVHHVGSFKELEDQMCTWVPDSGLASPDRMDALVWGLTLGMVERNPTGGTKKKAPSPPTSNFDSSPIG